MHHVKSARRVASIKEAFCYAPIAVNVIPHLPPYPSHQRSIIGGSLKKDAPVVRNSITHIPLKMSQKRLCSPYTASPITKFPCRRSNQLLQFTGHSLSLISLAEGGDYWRFHTYSVPMQNYTRWDICIILIMYRMSYVVLHVFDTAI